MSLSMSSEATSTNQSPRPKRNWLRLSLCMFLLVVTVCCIWLGWKINAAHEQRLAVAAVRSLGGWASYDYELDSDLSPLSPQPEPTWLVKVMGVDFLHNVVAVGVSTTVLNPKDYGPLLSHLRQFRRLRSLILYDGNFHDEDLKYLADLQELDFLGFVNNDINGVGFNYLSRLRTLKWLFFYGNPITDENVAAIPKLPNLERLDLGDTNITDACIESLAKLPNLSRINVNYTFITADGIRRLQELRPSLQIDNHPNRLPLAPASKGIGQ
jgi:Leucine-rich repeat (LRR) protein